MGKKSILKSRISLAKFMTNGWNRVGLCISTWISASSMTTAQEGWVEQLPPGVHMFLPSTLSEICSLWADSTKKCCCFSLLGDCLTKQQMSWICHYSCHRAYAFLYRSFVQPVLHNMRIAAYNFVFSS